MRRPGLDLSWRAIRQRHARAVERENNNTSNSNNNTTPLLAYSSKSLLANVTAGDELTYHHTSQTLPASVMNHLVPRAQARCKNPNHHHDPTDVMYPRDMRVLRSDMRAIMSELKYLTDHVRKGEEEDDVSQDWKFSAMVIDRLCLIIFSLLTTSLSYFTLFAAPNFFKLR